MCYGCWARVVWLGFFGLGFSWLGFVGYGFGVRVHGCWVRVFGLGLGLGLGLGI